MISKINNNKIYSGTNTEIQMKETSHKISKWEGIVAFPPTLIIAGLLCGIIPLAISSNFLIVFSPAMAAGGVVVVTEAIAIPILIHQYKQMSDLKKKCNQS